jgi:P-type E1-E2 ATPase
LIFDKTGTLTYGRPSLTDLMCAEEFDRLQVLQRTASLEQYSKHPLASAIVLEAKHCDSVRITGRKNVGALKLPLPPHDSGLECLVFIGGRYAAAIRFHDAPRKDSASFIQHLRPKHGVGKVMLVSGDRDTEVKYLVESVGITEVHAGKSPEEKVAIVKAETAKARTLFVGDGINDAPALMAATVGVAFGSHNDITAEAADAVVLETALEKIDELMHIARAHAADRLAECGWWNGCEHHRNDCRGFRLSATHLGRRGTGVD